MINPLSCACLVVELQVLWVLLAALSCYGVAEYLYRLKREDRAWVRRIRWLPKAVVLEPIREPGADFIDQVRRLLNQNYPDYRVVIVADSFDDTGRQRLLDLLGLKASAKSVIRLGRHDCPELAAISVSGLQSLDIMVAGACVDCGQKVHNLLFALEQCQERDEVLAFVDADALVAPDWLERLVHPLSLPKAGVSTGYRWLVPTDGGFVGRLASVMNASVATLEGPPWRNSAWAGSMAVLRSNWAKFGLAQAWRGALNDDYQTSRVVIGQGHDIVYASRVVPINNIAYNWRSFINFARRQYIQQRICRPEIWIVAVFLTSAITIGWVTCLAGLLAGNILFLVPLALVMSLDLIRARLRHRIMRSLFPEDVFEKLKPVLWLEYCGSFLYSAVHAVVIWSTMVGRTMTWCGIRYRINGRQSTKVLFRKS